MAKRKRHPSPKQRLRQIAFKFCCNAWSNYPWAQTELDAWLLYSLFIAIRQKNGKLRYLTPFQSFLKINIVRSYNGLELVFAAPLT